MAENKRSASERIENLENGLVSLYQTADNMARDLNMVKDALKLLGNKLDSVVKAASNGEVITDEVVSRYMIENNVAAMVDQGILVDQAQAEDNSFVVGKEVDDAGKVVNPRIQFVLNRLDKALQDKIKGSKKDDVLTLQEGKLKFQILELYSIQNPKPAEAAKPALSVVTPTDPQSAPVAATESVPSQT